MTFGDGDDKSAAAIADNGDKPPKKHVSNVAPPTTKSGIPGASSNLINTIVGSGIVGVPFALKECGFIGGLLLFSLVAFLTTQSLQMLIDVAMFNPKLKSMGIFTYEDMMLIPFGKWGRRLILASTLVLTYGASLSYLLILKQALPTVLGLGDSFVDREVPMLVAAVVIMLPLCMLRDMSRLAFTSMLSVVAEAALIVIVIVYSPVSSTVAAAGGFGQVIKENWINSGFFVGLGVLSSSMTCQHASFVIASSLKGLTPSRWAQVTNLSVWTSAALNMTMGIVGFLGFLNDTNGDILTNFPARTAGIDVGRGLLSATMVFTFPVQFFVLRQVFFQLLFNGKVTEETIDLNGEAGSRRRWCGLIGKFEACTFALFLLPLAPAMAVRDLGAVLSLTGAIGASGLAYIAPGFAYLGVYGGDFIHVTAKHVKASAKDDTDVSTRACESDEDTIATEGQNVLKDIDLEEIERGSPTNEVGIPKGSKPWWWWIAGFWLWTRVAAKGANNLETFILDFYEDESIASKHQSEEGETKARVGRFFLSIFFIVFGVVAMVAGVGSTIVSLVE